MCSQLGFGSSGKPADFGPGSGEVLMEIVNCTLNDAFPWPVKCNHYGVSITVGCDHSKDIGIKCKGTLICELNLPL